MLYSIRATHDGNTPAQLSALSKAGVALMGRNLVHVPAQARLEGSSTLMEVVASDERTECVLSATRTVAGPCRSSLLIRFDFLGLRSPADVYVNVNPLRTVTGLRLQEPVFLASKQALSDKR